MRFFLDTEFNGFRGELISIALVPEFGDQEFYAVLTQPEELHPWVERNVIPYLASVPEGVSTEPLPPAVAASEIEHYLSRDDAPVIVADWPEDIAHFCSLLITGPGEMVRTGSLRFEFVDTCGFSTAENSKVPHNALHDARSLRAFMLSEEAEYAR